MNIHLSEDTLQIMLEEYRFRNSALSNRVEFLEAQLEIMNREYCNL